MTEAHLLRTDVVAFGFVLASLAGLVALALRGLLWLIPCRRKA